MRKAYKPWTKMVIAMMSVFMFTIAILGSTAYASSTQQDVKEPKTTTTESENDKCDWVDWDAVAAQAIGIDTDTLYEEWFANDNTSIADVAKTRGVEPQKIIDAIVAAETEWLKQQVADGQLSQEDADLFSKETEPFAKEYVETTPVVSEGEMVDWDAVAAQALGTDTDTLYNELDTGTSIADVAKARGVEPQQVIDAIVAAERELLNQEVADGYLSQKDADQLLTEIAPFAQEFVEMSLVEEEEVEE
ncbi:MAG: hypothetical protein AAGF95_31020 [Chloroflexota bacterium]